MAEIHTQFHLVPEAASNEEVQRTKWLRVRGGIFEIIMI